MLNIEVDPCANTPDADRLLYLPPLAVIDITKPDPDEVKLQLTPEDLLSTGHSTICARHTCESITTIFMGIIPPARVVADDLTKTNL